MVIVFQAFITEYFRVNRVKAFLSAQFKTRRIMSVFAVPIVRFLSLLVKSVRPVGSTNASKWVCFAFLSLLGSD